MEEYRSKEKKSKQTLKQSRIPKDTVKIKTILHFVLISA